MKWQETNGNHRKHWDDYGLRDGYGLRFMKSAIVEYKWAENEIRTALTAPYHQIWQNVIWAKNIYIEFIWISSPISNLYAIVFSHIILIYYTINLSVPSFIKSEWKRVSSWEVKDRPLADHLARHALRALALQARASSGKTETWAIDA